MKNIIKNVQNSMKLIGKHKYNYFKSIDFKSMSSEDCIIFKKHYKISVLEAEKAIEKYESVYKKEISEESKAYLSSLGKPKNKKIIPITKDWLYKRFLQVYLNQNSVEYSKNEASIENIKPLIYYFIGDLENFKKCKNVSQISTPSLSKGLLIIGSYGNGKTSSIKALEKSLQNTPLHFKGYGATEIVKMYEQCETPLDKQEFSISAEKGIRYFDDVLTEDIASNYGKSDLFKAILEERYRNNCKTYITCNYKNNLSQNIKSGLLQFADRYGPRVYDRLFEMFNFIEFNGKSFRK